MASLPAKSIVDVLMQLVDVPKGAVSFSIHVDNHAVVTVDCTYRVTPLIERPKPIIPQPE